MTATDAAALPLWFDTGLSAWLAMPLDAMRSPLAILFLFAFGLLHALLPGHGKALLAVHGASAERGAGMPGHGTGPRYVLALLDGTALALCRTLVAFALVVGTVRLAGAFGFAIPVSGLRILAGLALAAIGAHLAWHALRSGQNLRVDPGIASVPRNGGAARSGPRGHVARSLVVLALTPEPVALAIASYGVAQGALPAAALGCLGLALGMGVTLGTIGLLGRRYRHRLSTYAPVASLAIAAILMMTGAIVAAGA